MMGEGDDSKSRDMCDGVGERGNEVLGGGDCSHLTGAAGEDSVEDVNSAGEALRESDSDGELVVIDVGVGGCAPGAEKPWAASAFMTASQPFSRVRMRSFSSSFSRSWARWR